MLLSMHGYSFIISIVFFSNNNYVLTYFTTLYKMLHIITAILFVTKFTLMTVCKHIYDETFIGPENLADDKEFVS